ncbi:hypothetical protein [Lonsdalea populi]|uniref:hypothetical protein n=1 Tax=Lonsdalea populi TaxID=1172565 RepID=UPI000A1E2E18|nr:hypothetical protein [Lonsdalea populi]OSM98520.1 hypothetical protein AU508_03830 [Lonsdalea populi]OSN01608.1 hypothetical protein AU499_05815 [Lonsdalea populi]QPQ24760.1 hypothetical protein I6N93_02815 [Lonsdalea populi]RAT40191.1 hypothetical protein AU494_16295 [Lonsdalea populi]RAT46154.1 hypothetical protein AU495_03825 [Lonsdalea populi]
MLTPVILGVGSPFQQTLMPMLSLVLFQHGLISPAPYRAGSSGQLPNGGIINTGVLRRDRWVEMKTAKYDDCEKVPNKQK